MNSFDYEQKISALQNENEQLLQQLEETKKNYTFWLKKSAELLPEASKSKTYFRTALFSCYLGGIFCSAFILGGHLFRTGSLLSLLMVYVVLLIGGALGLLTIGALSFGVSHFVLCEKDLPKSFVILLILVPPLIPFFFMSSFQ